MDLKRVIKMLIDTDHKHTKANNWIELNWIWILDIIS